MGRPQPKTTFTVDEYLVLERASQERHEYIDGSIYSMAGESHEHGNVTMNLGGILHAQLKGTPCFGRVKDNKVRSGPMLTTGSSTKGMFSYPDLVVICGEAEYHDRNRDIVLNPKVIIEVLSESTEAF